MDWIALQAFCGAVLPPIIELFFKNVHKTAKAIVVVIFAIITVAIQMGIKGAWDLPLWQILLNVVSLMYFSIASFTFFWKKLFPNDTPPDIGVPITPDINATLTRSK